MARQRITTILMILLMAACAGGTLFDGDGDGESGDDATDGNGDDGDDSSGGGGDDDDGGGGGGDEDTAPDDTLPTYPTQHPRIYVAPHRARLKAALDAGAPAAVKFRGKVDAWLGGANIWGFEAWNGALLGQLTDHAAYCTKAVATIEAQVVAAEAKIAAGSAPEVARDHYLHVGELIGDLALVYDWCFAQVTPAQRTRWLAYANQAVSNVWNHTTAKWGGQSFPWTGWSVNNPSNNYYYSFLRATMLLGLAAKGESPQADLWIAKFRDKVLGQLVPAFSADLVGGGSREGTGYGVAMRRLFELYSWWKATTGENLATKTGHTRASLLAFIHQVMPTLDRVAPTGDHARDRTAAFFDYHRDYLQQLMQIFPSSTLSRRAKHLLAGSTVPAMTMPFMLAYDFMNDSAAMSPLALSGLNTVYHGKGMGQIYARSGWDTAATWVNFTAGPYTEQHAHQDQGAFLIYRGGWLAHDANVHSHSGLSQATTSHNVVRIDAAGAPIKQHFGTTSTLLALREGANYVYAAADVTAAYKGNPAIQKVQRELVYLQPNIVVVFDRVTTTTGTTQAWQLNTPVAPSISGNTATISNAGHTLKVTRIAPSAATMTSYDHRANSDMTGGYRLDQRVAGGDQRHLNVLSVDGAASSVAATGTTAQPGVTIALVAGGQATVTFHRDTVGGTLVIGGASTTLAAGIDTLPE